MTPEPIPGIAGAIVAINKHFNKALSGGVDARVERLVLPDTAAKTCRLPETRGTAGSAQTFITEEVTISADRRWVNGLPIEGVYLNCVVQIEEGNIFNVKHPVEGVVVEPDKEGVFQQGELVKLTSEEAEEAVAKALRAVYGDVMEDE